MHAAAMAVGQGMDPGWVRQTGGATPAAQRGRLRIADRVLARIASRAAREALAASWADDAPRAAPRVSVAVSHGAARVRVGVDLPFPSDLEAHAVAVRDAVAERVGALTGVATREVVVVVERLCPRPLPGRAEEG